MARRVYDRFCPLSMALDEVGDRWTLHIVYALLGGPLRYVDLRHYLSGAGANVLGDRLRRLADAQIVGRSTGDRPGSDTTYHLTERGRALAPVIQGLVRWGLAALTGAAPDADRVPDREVFDQTWAIPDVALVADETYQWTVVGVVFALAVAGCSLARTRGPAHDPIVTLTTTSKVLDAIVTGERTVASAVSAGELALTGPPDATQRMFIVVGFPRSLLGF